MSDGRQGQPSPVADALILKLSKLGRPPGQQRSPGPADEELDEEEPLLSDVALEEELNDDNVDELDDVDDDDELDDDDDDDDELDDDELDDDDPQRLEQLSKSRNEGPIV